MNAPFSTLLTALQTRVKELLPAIKWVDQDYGQLEYYDQRPAVEFPCLLVDFDNFQFEDAGEAIQFATGNVVLRLAFAPYSNTSNITPDQWKQKGLQYYELEWALYKALHGWKPNAELPDEHYGYMMRVSSDTEKREDPFRVRRLIYSVTFEDYNASPEYNMRHLPGLLDLDMDIVLDAEG